MKETKYTSMVFSFTLKLVKLSEEEINKWTQIKSFSIILPKLQGKFTNLGAQKKPIAGIETVMQNSKIKKSSQLENSNER